MVYVAGGLFVLGTSDQQIDQLASDLEEAREWRERGFFAREQPEHRVHLADYLIGRYPVTVGQYRAFVEAEGYRQQRYWTETGWTWREAAGRVVPSHWQDEAWTGDDRLPVVGVSWNEALAFCRWLGEVTGHDYRLPTEAEWETAAGWRPAHLGFGGGKRIYPWGDEFDASRCNARPGGLGRTTPVGQFSPQGDSLFRCADMAGNVSEWTSSRFQPYRYRARDGREVADGEAERVTRGGSWHSPVLQVRTTSRGMNDPFYSDNDLGFRLALSTEGGL
jgi:formylglycine-generating enzyme required for sulfatase activity